ncbi:hypothetical protein ALI144C_24145 [Actinosynnema sp. ALI-1.44]|uniref:hypothetical protein n=1 Tax=Actinosynnema sp. ALI-1.44 TaxID=1933779 RepID=UPI00097C9AD6|nr:hypothetical protein [Actinosynnema sp. ALI-1.44]ONI79828.1 hypothetical protein ALI144C_24145 [Actinosynnema sp. ALI-1.44]
MLDEHREIWVQIYGPDQPMTQMDVGVLDDRLSHIKGAVTPLLAELTAIQGYVSSQVAAAVAERDDAQTARHQAEQHMAAANTERDQAQADARTARTAAEADRAERDEANARATTAETAATQAATAQQTAETARDDAQRERQQALQQVSDMQQRVTELQTTLQSERIATVDSLARLRAEHTEDAARLRSTLLADYEQKLAEQNQNHASVEDQIRRTAEARVDALTRQLAQAAQDYAQTLAPLHSEKATLAQRLAEHTTRAEQIQRRLDTLTTGLAELVDQLPQDNTISTQLTQLLNMAGRATGDGA